MINKSLAQMNAERAAGPARQKKIKRGQQILRQCTREVEQSLAKFGLGLRKIKKYKVTSSRVGPPNKVKGSKLQG